MKIYNPFKNTFVDLQSFQGIKLLKKYVKNYQNGGTGTGTEAVETTEVLETADIGSGGDPQEAELPKYGNCPPQDPSKYSCENKIVVVFLGGFHPFHRGHFLSYYQAKQTFGENVCFYVAASNSWPKYKPGKKAPEYEYLRPFPFEAKKQLAILSGVNENEIICEQSPMVLLNLRKKVDIDNKHLIIVRSEKEIEDELITSGEEAIEIMVSKILSIKSNKMSEQEIRNKAEKQLIEEEGPENNPAYYKITGRGANRKIEYDNYQPIPDECYEYDEDRYQKFKFNEESINLLKHKSETQIGFIHITKTVNIEGVGSLDLSSGTKIRKAYIEAQDNLEMKKVIIKALYPSKTPEDYNHILKIYDTYLNNTFFENVPTKPSGKSKSKAGGVKKSKSKTAKKTL
jgi:hypothetical protein